MPLPPFNPTDVADSPPDMLPDQESYSEMANEVEPKPTAGLKLDSITIRPTKNGSFIAQCSKSAIGGDGGPGPGGYESNDYAFKSIEEVHAFVIQQLKGYDVRLPGAGTGGD